MKLNGMDPKLRRRILEADAAQNPKRHALQVPINVNIEPPAPRLNGIESDYRDYLKSIGWQTVLEQRITLALDPPLTSYRADLAVVDVDKLTLFECKGKHRFREKGIAKVALAAKTYPMFRFILVERDHSGWKTTTMTP